jgi:hypothetical protein
VFLFSSHDAASDDNSLGRLVPSADLYHTPLFKMQALWQVDTHPFMAGVAHWSSILNDQ